MTINLDSLSINLTCPQCGQEINETLGRLKHDPQLTCPGCGIQIDANQFRDAIQSAEKSLDDFATSLSKLGK